MAKITLDSILSGYQSTSQVNSNNTLIADHLNNKVLYRNNPTGETNSMLNNLDMNSHRILNLPSPSSDLEPARWIDIKNSVSTEIEPIPALTGNEGSALSTTGSTLVFKKFDQVFDTVSDLATSDVYVGQYVCTKGYTTIGDGGANDYLIVAAGTGTHDGGSYIDLATHQAQGLFSSGRININQFGAIGDDSTDNITALNAAVAYADVLHIPVGIYQYTPPLNIDKAAFVLKGDSKYNSILKTKAVAADGIHLGANASSSAVKLERFRLRGNSTNHHGIRFGTAGSYISVINQMEELYVESFTNTGYSNIEIEYGWWLDFKKCALEGGYYNVHTPTNAATTTINFHENCTLRNSLDICIYLEGTWSSVDYFFFKQCAVEYAEKEALRCDAERTIIVVEDGYFEQNSASGPGIITLNGGSGLHDYIIFNMTNTKTDAPLSGNSMNLSWVFKSTIQDSPGWLAAPIVTDSNCEIFFRNMNARASSNMLAAGRAMLGRIVVEDLNPATGELVKYTSNGNFFEGHINAIQPALPTVATGVGLGSGGSVAMKAHSTDTAGQVQATFGSSGWIGSTIFTVTFSKPYNTVPTVLLFPASTKAGQQLTKGLNVSNVTTTNFSVNLATAETASGLAFYNYMVIGGRV